jgi:acetylornithine deacetylase/succinyl-diaminopimelate desuccinylase family protein
MLLEIDEQLTGLHATHVFMPVGVGSFAQAVTSYFRREGSSTSVIAVEPDTAAYLRHSLELGCLASVKTIPTIMAGLDCGTVSTIAWPVLEKGVRASMSISDYEAYSAVVYLESQGIFAGPCGASTVAALRRLSSDDKIGLGIDSSSVIVLVDDPVKLTQILVQINSANPSLGSVPGPGETAIARYIYSWLQHRGLEAHWIEPTKGRPSVVGVTRGSGGGKSLMLNGHIDTVTTMGYEGDPLSGTIADGKLYGRGAADMKCGVAAAMVALANSKRMGLKGDVIFTGVADEENLSIGTEDVLRAGWRADGAIINEPTNLCVVNAHKGFVWLEITVHGTAAHGSRADLGVDAIAKAGHFLAELDRYAARLQEIRPDSYVGPPTIHASLIRGGEEASSYPAACHITVERRTLPGETAESVEKEIRTILEEIEERVQNFKSDVKVTASRPAFESSQEGTFCQLVCQEVGKTMGDPPRIGTVAYWTDCALLAEAGIPALLWGPTGDGLHAKEESVDIESIRIVADALTSVAGSFCR